MSFKQKSSKSMQNSKYLNIQNYIRRKRSTEEQQLQEQCNPIDIRKKRKVKIQKKMQSLDLDNNQLDEHQDKQYRDQLQSSSSQFQNKSHVKTKNMYAGFNQIDQSGRPVVYKYYPKPKSKVKQKIIQPDHKSHKIKNIILDQQIQQRLKSRQKQKYKKINKRQNIELFEQNQRKRTTAMTKSKIQNKNKYKYKNKKMNFFNLQQGQDNQTQPQSYNKKEIIQKNQIKNNRQRLDIQANKNNKFASNSQQESIQKQQGIEYFDTQNQSLFTLSKPNSYNLNYNKKKQQNRHQIQQESTNDFLNHLNGYLLHIESFYKKIQKVNKKNNNNAQEIKPQRYFNKNMTSLNSQQNQIFISSSSLEQQSFQKSHESSFSKIQQKSQQQYNYKQEETKPIIMSKHHQNTNFQIQQKDESLKKLKRKVKTQKSFNKNLQKCVFQIQKVLFQRNDKLQLLENQIQKIKKKKKSIQIQRPNSSNKIKTSKKSSTKSLVKLSYPFFNNKNISQNSNKDQISVPKQKQKQNYQRNKLNCINNKVLKQGSQICIKANNNKRTKNLLIFHQDITNNCKFNKQPCLQHISQNELQNTLSINDLSQIHQQNSKIINKYSQKKQHNQNQIYYANSVHPSPSFKCIGKVQRQKYQQQNIFRKSTKTAEQISNDYFQKLLKSKSNTFASKKRNSYSKFKKKNLNDL